ncbi:Snf6p Ecym_6221 [Eremothecium cymbalariae DBVPG|uniref:Uncharacterized protein n=1 Tax=Eremothecium cymbalariae (strain CBS 270.75 / DBVPG 7215 / KCTC 17166 / NRRL Y-17582) TaxID=931890 RepID=G8JVC4_ERECY|nr:hypothetical protein Ecym_6221 [Eremothecium cymbalariae DBVPG\
MAKRGRKPLNRGWRLLQQNGHHGQGQHGTGMHSQQGSVQQKLEKHKSQRLNPEQIGTSVHDESDTISFRNHLLANYILTAEWMDVLTTQAVPVSRIRKPRIYSEETRVEAMRQQLSGCLEEVEQLERRLESHAKQGLFGEPTPFRQCWKELSRNPFDKEVLDRVQEKYEKHFGLTIRPDTTVIYRNRFSYAAHLVGNKAPDNYWTELYPQLKERELQLQREQLKRERLEKERIKMEEEMLKKQLEEEEELKRKEQEERERQLQLQIQSDAAVQQATEQQEQDVNPAGNQLLDSMFNDINTEPFNTGFDDAFGGLDSAFF